ncbi:MAG: rod shape-determining protein MreD [Ignavibacteriales bacterium]|nr:MAG: rod shape-determining protein MreD [Ignavibacteriales bacterium]
MRSDYFISLLIFFPVLVIQTTIVPLISLSGVVPDLILIVLVYYSIRNGQIYGAVAGFVFGLFFDLITGSLLGSAMLSKTFVGFIAGYFSNENKREIYLHSYPFILIVLLCSIIDSIVYAFFSDTDFNRNVLLLFFEQGMLPGLFTAVVSLLVMIFAPKRRFG